ncbi:MAG: hypothetical protein CBB79_02765 [Synechococcus sp. TMED19]|nr:MAG: hypothetical protein CBB79_02765 [Synechococcus sp. TMED19]
MRTPALMVLIGGLTGLVLTVINAATFHPATGAVPPAFERASVLSGAMAVALLLVSILWTQANPKDPEKVELDGFQGMLLVASMPNSIKQEMGWGSTLLLTATPASTMLLVWDQRVLLKRGVLASGGYGEGPIVKRAKDKQQTISLVNLALYPGRDEFSYLPPNTPAVVVEPLGGRGVLIIGGWSPRCFSRSDEVWIEGWARKLRTQLELLPEVVFQGPLVPPESEGGSLPSAPELKT